MDSQSIPLDTQELKLGDVALSFPAESDKEELRRAANHEETWRWFTYRADGEYFDSQFWPFYMAEHDPPRNIHYVVRYKNEVVGSTCFLNADETHKRVEIGGTWYCPEVRGTVVNPSCKLLLMQRAFDWGAHRVEWKTDSRNARSRAAIEKLGAKLDGVLRCHMINHDGSQRDSVYYSMIPEEWPIAKLKLEQRIASHF